MCAMVCVMVMGIRNEARREGDSVNEIFPAWGGTESVWRVEI